MYFGVVTNTIVYGGGEVCLADKFWRMFNTDEFVQRSLRDNGGIMEGGLAWFMVSECELPSDRAVCATIVEVPSNGTDMWVAPVSSKCQHEKRREENGMIRILSTVGPPEIRGENMTSSTINP